MNTNNGQVYRTMAEINAAKERGEPVAEVSERVAEAVEVGMSVLNRRERRKQAAEARGKVSTRSKPRRST